MLATHGPICHLNLASGFSGGERQTELLVRELAGRGVSQRLVAREESGLADRCSDVPDLDIRVVPGHHLRAALAIRGASIAHAHDGRAVYAALFGYWLHKVPYVATRRVITGKPIRGLRSIAYHRAARVVAVSSATAQDLKSCGLSRSVDVVADARATLPVDPARAAAIRTAHAGKVLIGHAGTLNDSAKGQLTIIDAARSAATDHPDWHFMLLGEGRDRQRFTQAIGELTNVELVGWVDNFGDYLSAFDLFVFPSRHEALGSSMLDALQMGLPIVATDVGGIPGVVEHGANGRLIGVGDADAMVAAIESLLADEEELTAIRVRNAEKSKSFDTTHMADAYETLYREIATQV